MEVKEGRKMKQLYQTLRGLCGGYLINLRIWEIMGEVFGSNVIDKYKDVTNDFLELESIIETQKENLSLKKEFHLPVFPSFADLCLKENNKGWDSLVNESKYRNSMCVDAGALFFKPHLVDHILDLTLANLFIIMKKILHNKYIVPIKSIILVGGLARSDVIVKKIRNEFSDLKIIVPKHPELAVLNGAWLVGIDSA